MTIRRGSAKRSHLAQGVIFGSALFGAAAVIVGAMPTNSASAQTTEELLKRVEMLEAERVHGGVGGVKFTLSGRVNKMIVYSNEGDTNATGDSRVIHVIDNSNAGSSRFRFLADGKVNDMVSTHGKIEMDLRPNRGNVNQTDDPDDPSVNLLRVRNAFISVKHAKIGKVSLGRISVASIGIASTGDHGTSAGFATTSPMFAEGVTMRRENDGVNKMTVGSVVNGLSLGAFAPGIRYDTPSFGGASAGFSFVDETYQVGISYGGSLGSFEVQVKGGYNFRGDNEEKGNKTDKIAGGLSILHTSGMNFSVGGASDRNPRDGVEKKVTTGQNLKESEYADQFGWRLGLGFKKNLTGAGNSNFSVHYHRSENKPHITDITTMVSAAIQQNWDKSGTNLYVVGSYLTHENNQSNAAKAGKFAEIGDFGIEKTAAAAAVEEEKVVINGVNSLVQYKPVFQVGIGVLQRF